MEGRGRIWKGAAGGGAREAGPFRKREEGREREGRGEKGPKDGAKGEGSDRDGAKGEERGGTRRQGGAGHPGHPLLDLGLRALTPRPTCQQGRADLDGSEAGSEEGLEERRAPQPGLSACL